MLRKLQLLFLRKLVRGRQSRLRTVSRHRANALIPLLMRCLALAHVQVPTDDHKKMQILNFAI